MIDRLRGVVLAWAVALAAMFSFTQAALAAADCADANIANSAGNAFLQAARSESAENFAHALDEYADMGYISSFALGRYRKQVPAERTDQLVSLTSRYVSVTLADFARKFRGLRIYAIDCRPDGTVKSRLEFGGGRSAQTVIWRFKDAKVVDVNIQDAWLAQLLRSNFYTIIQDGNGNIDALFARLEKS